MPRTQESDARIKLAGRILVQLRTRSGQPLLQSEVAQLRFLAESDEELKMPVDELAQTVIERERKRMGIEFPHDALPGGGRN